MAAFTDANPLEKGDDLTATVAWNDGKTDSGTISSTETGAFAVSDARSFRSPGDVSATVTIFDGNRSAAVVNLSGSVAVAPFTISGGSLTVLEGREYSGSVGTLGDSNPDSSPLNFSASYDLNGVVYPVRIDGGNGSYSLNVTGIGPFDFSATDAPGTITVIEAGETQVTAGNLSVTDAPLSVTGSSSLSATVGQRWNGTVATIDDGNPSEDDHNLAARVFWNDGQTDAGTLVALGNGEFTINDSRVFSTSGDIGATITVADNGGSTDTANVSSDVAVAPFSVGGGGLSVQEGANYSGMVGTINDSNPNSSSSNFTATYYFNGTTYSATVEGSNGNYSLDVSNVGPFDPSMNGAVGTVAVIETDASGSSNGTIEITDAPLAISGDANLSAINGRNWTGSVATITDVDKAETGIDLSAVIAWNDGQTDTGTLVPLQNGAFEVVDSRVFDFTGSIFATVSVYDMGGATPSSATCIGNSSLSPFTVGGGSSCVQEGGSYTGTVGTITDSDPNSSPSNFTASYLVNGAIYPVAVDGLGGNYSLDVSNVGPFNISSNGEGASVTVTRSGVSESSSGSLSVTDAPLYLNGNAIVTATAGQSWSDIVATVHDSDADESGSHLSATVYWSDGQNDTGVIVPLGSGNFSINDSRTSNQAGGASADVVVNDTGGCSANAMTSCEIAVAPFSIGGGSLSVQEGSAYMGSVGTIVDTNPYSLAASFSASFYLDGTSYPTTIDGSNGSFSIDVNNIGSFDLAQGGNTASLTVTEGGITKYANGSLSVFDAPLSLTPISGFKVKAGVTWSGAIAGLADSDVLETGSHLTAYVSWSDGASTVGRLVSDGQGAFEVDASRSFSTPGTVTALTTVYDAGGSAASATSSVIVEGLGNAGSDPYPFSVGGMGFSIQEGLQYSGIVGSIGDSNPESSPDDFTATYEFHGATYPTTVWGSGGSYSIGVNNIGPFDLSANGDLGTVTVIGPNDTETGSATVNVTDAALAVNGGSVISATVGQNWNNTIATVSDSDLLETGSDLSATVNWSDGQSDAGALTPEGGGTFSVSDSRTFGSAGTSVRM